MPIKFIPYLYLFDENKNYIGVEKLKIKKEEFIQNYEKHQNPLMMCLHMKPTKIKGAYWLFELIVKLGKEYYYPHFCMLTENIESSCNVHGIDEIFSYTINDDSTFEKLSINFELSSLISRCNHTTILEQPKTIDKIINFHTKNNAGFH